MDAEGPLLICYDGSEGAEAALRTAVGVFPGHEALVVCFWQPFAESSKRLAVDILELVQDAEAINEREAELAQQIADEGAALAAAGGLAVEGRAIRISSPIDEAILGIADEIDAAAIVLGSRSRSSLRSLILGDVANEVVQRATRPVFVTPSGELAERRREGLLRGLGSDARP